MKPVALYVIGAPGAGKSTTVEHALRALEWSVLPGELRLHGLLRGQALVSPAGRTSGVYLGKQRPSFPGTDALSMGVHPDAVTWAAALPETTELIVGEGARLGTVGFLTELKESAHLVLVHVTAPEERRELNRSTQSATWRAGRKTAAERTFAAFHDDPAVLKLALDTGQLTPEAAGRRVAGIVHAQRSLHA